MKLSTFTATAAVIGRSFLIPVPAEARNGGVNAGTDVDNGATILNRLVATSHTVCSSTKLPAVHR